MDVLGHSMGGKAAMVLALARPDLVRRLVVADIAPVAYGHTQMPQIASSMMTSFYASPEGQSFCKSVGLRFVTAGPGKRGARTGAGGNQKGGRNRTSDVHECLRSVLALARWLGFFGLPLHEHHHPFGR